jgi:hypothetical protein
MELDFSYLQTIGKFPLKIQRKFLKFPSISAISTDSPSIHPLLFVVAQEGH